MEKETIFWNKETMVYLLFWKAVSFQNTFVQYLHFAIQIQLWMPEKGPKKLYLTFDPKAGKYDWYGNKESLQPCLLLCDAQDFWANVTM